MINRLEGEKTAEYGISSRIRPNGHRPGYLPQPLNPNIIGQDEIDVLRIYFQEISQYPLLKAADEVRLAKAMEAGKAAEKRGDKEGNELECIRKGEEAREQLTGANLRLVVKLAKRYAKYNKGSLPDLIQEGNIGLMTAVERFDWRKGCRFSTYAAWRIRRAIREASGSQARSIFSLPVHIEEIVHKLTTTREHLEKELDRTPTNVELAHAVGSSPGRRFSPARVSAILNLRDTVNLQTPVGEYKDVTVADLIEDQESLTPEAVVLSEFRRQAVINALRRLKSDRARAAVILAWGLDGNEPRNLTEIGKALGCSRQNATQILKTAMQGLKSQELRDYYLS